MFHHLSFPLEQKRPSVPARKKKCPDHKFLGQVKGYLLPFSAKKDHLPGSRWTSGLYVWTRHEETRPRAGQGNL